MKSFGMNLPQYLKVQGLPNSSSHGFVWTLTLCVPDANIVHHSPNLIRRLHQIRNFVCSKFPFSTLPPDTQGLFRIAAACFELPASSSVHAPCRPLPVRCSGRITVFDPCSAVVVAARALHTVLPPSWYRLRGARGGSSWSCAGTWV